MTVLAFDYSETFVTEVTRATTVDLFGTVAHWADWNGSLHWTLWSSDVRKQEGFLAH